MLPIFPEEIWIKILLLLPCYKIIDLCEIKQFKELCDKNNLIERRKLYGFPRKTGHCLTHDVSELISCDYEDLNHLFYDAEEGSQAYLKEILIELIDDLDHNLIRGDLIYYEEIDSEYIKYIFDGCNIIMLDYDFDEEGHIPNEFSVIINDIPTDYWVSSEEHQGFPFNNYIWFDHSIVRYQLIDNAKIDKKNNMIFTKFTYNNKEHTIVFNNNNHYPGYNYSLKNFIYTLKGKKLLLKYIEIDEIKNLFDVKLSESVLYLDVLLMI
jgi:hypothetical protein